MYKLLFCFLLSLCTYSQETLNPSFVSGEVLEFRVHYGLFNTSYSSLKVTDTLFRGTPSYYVKAHGETTGLAKLFFEVDDNYYSIFSKDSVKPLEFYREVKEGNYRVNEKITFDYKQRKAIIDLIIISEILERAISNEIQDIISGFYFFRSLPDKVILNKNVPYEIPMIYNNEGAFTFKLRYDGEEKIETIFGEVDCYRFKPFLPSIGRIFNDPNAITIWVTKDKNRIPVKVKAKIVVGSITADLQGATGLKYPGLLKIQ
jgi:hypothetical protein